MAKSKKKKNEHKDFQKVKLKVGKKLPKGQNETVAVFATRKIQMKEQLKVSLDKQPTTKRKLNIHELLSQCNHCNVSVKHDAIVGMKELLGTHPSILQKYTGQILEKCSEMFLDKDKVVRGAVHKLLGSAFSKISANTISAFFSVISAHLCCAMTHINDEIQQDSLLIIDLCLEHFPKLTVNASNILNNFIEQISRQTQISGKDSAQERNLIINPNSKLSGQKWRNKVLERLRNFFTSYLNFSMNITKKKVNVWLDNENNNETALDFMFNRDEQRQNCLNLFANMDCEAASVVEIVKQNTTIFKEKDYFNMHSFVDILFPLLLQCWIEVGPSQLATDLPDNALNSEAINTLWNVLSVLHLLLQILERQSDGDVTVKRFKEKYFNDLINYFMPHFPYAMHEKRQTTKGAKSKIINATSQISVKSLNLLVCKIMSYFINKNYSQSKRNSNNSWRDKILAYLVQSLQPAKLNSDQTVLVVDIVQCIVVTSQDNEEINTLLEFVFNILKHKQSSVTVEVLTILKFFQKNAFERQLMRSKEPGFPVLLSWLKTLPEFIPLALKGTKEFNADFLTCEILQLLKCAATLKNDGFSSTLKRIFFQTLIESESGLDLLCCISVTNQIRLVQLMYWITDFTAAECNSIKQFICNEKLEMKVAYTIIEVHCLQAVEKFDQGLHNSLCPADLLHIVNHFSLMCSLILGKDIFDEKDCYFCKSVDGSTIYVKMTSLHSLQYNRRLFIMESTVSLTRNLVVRKEMREILFQFIQKHLNYKTQDDVCAFSSIGTGKMFSVLSSVNDDSTNSVINNEKLMGKLCYDISSTLTFLTALSNGDIYIDPQENTLQSATSSEPSTIIAPKTSDIYARVRVAVTVLWQQCVQCFQDLPLLYNYYMKGFCQKLKDLHSFEEVKTLCLASLKLLCEESSLKKHLTGDIILLLKKTVQIGCDNLGETNEQWWSKLKYEVSLL